MAAVVVVAKVKPVAAEPVVTEGHRPDPLDQRSSTAMGERRKAAQADRVVWAVPGARDSVTRASRVMACPEAPAIAVQGAPAVVAVRAASASARAQVATPRQDDGPVQVAAATAAVEVAVVVAPRVVATVAAGAVDRPDPWALPIHWPTTLAPWVRQAEPAGSTSRVSFRLPLRRPFRHRLRWTLLLQG